jgi:hypothetical protein
MMSTCLSSISKRSRDYHLGVSSRAATGFSNARKAYVDAKRELEKREQAIKR